MSNPFVQPLEGRQLLSATWHDGSSIHWGDYSITLRFGNLQVVGSSRNDHISVYPELFFNTGGGGPIFDARTFAVKMGGKTQHIPIDLVRQIHISGGDGNDTIQMQPFTAIAIDQCGQTVNSTPTGARPAGIDGGDGNDTIFGSDFTDIISGGSGNDSISGQGGGDVISGGDGDDIIDGGEGNDRINAGAGSDQVHGGIGNDVLVGSNGRDTLRGDDGNDRILGGNGIDWADQKPSSKRSTERELQGIICITPFPF